MLPIDQETARSARFLAQLITALDSSAVPPDLCPKVVSAVAEAIGDICAICTRDPSTGSIQVTALHHPDSRKLPLLQRLIERWLDARPVPLHHRDLPAEAPLMVSMADEEKAAGILGSPEGVRAARRAGVSHLLIMPLSEGDQALGYLWIASMSTERPFTDDRIDFARGIARGLSSAIAQLENTDTPRREGTPAARPSPRLKAILDSIPQGVALAGVPEGQVLFANKSLSELLGREVCEETQLSLYPEQSGLAHPGGAPYLPEELPWVRTALSGEPVAAEEMVITRPDGKVVLARCSTSPLLADAGDPSGVIAVLQDVTDRKEFEREKDEFLAMVSHELRTPLASIKGSAQFLQRRMQAKPGLPLGKTEMDMLQIMDQQVNRLVRLVSDLTQYSIIQVGRLELLRRTFDLGMLTSDIIHHVQEAAPGYDLQLSVQGDVCVDADAERIEQVLYNLITNGIKAARTTRRARKPVVSVHIHKCEDGNVLTSVSDDGVGIGKDIQGLIFQRLYRGPDRSHEGMGLGLYISKGIVDAHGGRIWFESEQGKGTTFYFTLPGISRKAPADAPSEGGKASPTGCGST